MLGPSIIQRSAVVVGASVIVFGLAGRLGPTEPAPTPLAPAPERAPPEVVAIPANVPVPFELGATELARGDRVAIDTVEGPVDHFAVGHTYRVTGHYALESHDEATLLLSVTRTERDAEDSIPARLRVLRGVGTFDLEIEIRSRGYPHVTLYDARTGAPFSGAYFGHGDWLLREKSWRYAATDAR